MLLIAKPMYTFCAVPMVWLGHSTVTGIRRNTLTNLDSKRTAVAKLEGNGDSLAAVGSKK